MTLTTLVPLSWRPALREAIEALSFSALDTFLTQEAAAGHTIFPPREQLFAALEYTAPSEVKVVLLGQDPYPTAGNANGLSFSVGPGMKLPGSLRNMFAGLSADLGGPAPTSGDLSGWAKQGVLLLNTVLTVREGEANSHQGRGWEPFTEAIVRHVNAQPRPIVFLCFGKHAQQLVTRLVDGAKHVVMHEPHPSPLNGKKFVESVKQRRIFSKANEVLRASGREPVDWLLLQTHQPGYRPTP